MVLIRSADGGAIRSEPLYPTWRRSELGKGDLAMLSPDGFFRGIWRIGFTEELSEPKAVVAPIALSRGTSDYPGRLCEGIQGSGSRSG